MKALFVSSDLVRRRRWMEWPHSHRDPGRPPRTRLDSGITAPPPRESEGAHRRARGAAGGDDCTTGCCTSRGRKDAQGPGHRETYEFGPRLVSAREENKATSYAVFIQRRREPDLLLSLPTSELKSAGRAESTVYGLRVRFNICRSSACYVNPANSGRTAASTHQPV